MFTTGPASKMLPLSKGSVLFREKQKKYMYYNILLKNRHGINKVEPDLKL